MGMNNDVILNIDILLRKMGKRRSWLSKKTGIPFSTISTWQSQNRIPRLDQAYAIAKALNVTLEQLITGKDDIMVIPTDNPDLIKVIKYLITLPKSDIYVIIGMLKAFTVYQKDGTLASGILKEFPED